MAVMHSTGYSEQVTQIAEDKYVVGKIAVHDVLPRKYSILYVRAGTVFQNIPKSIPNISHTVL